MNMLLSENPDTRHAAERMLDTAMTGLDASMQVDTGRRFLSESYKAVAANRKSFTDWEAEAREYWIQLPAGVVRDGVRAESLRITADHIEIQNMPTMRTKAAKRTTGKRDRRTANLTKAADDDIGDPHTAAAMQLAVQRLLTVVTHGTAAEASPPGNTAAEAAETAAATPPPGVTAAAAAPGPTGATQPLEGTAADVVLPGTLINDATGAQTGDAVNGVNGGMMVTLGEATGAALTTRITAPAAPAVLAAGTATTGTGSPVLAQVNGTTGATPQQENIIEAAAVRTISDQSAEAILARQLTCKDCDKNVKKYLQVSLDQDSWICVLFVMA